MRMTKEEFVRKALHDMAAYKRRKVYIEKKKEADYAGCIAEGRRRMWHYQGAAFKRHK